MTNENTGSLVERILTGEAHEESEEVQALLTANPEMREELAEMRFLQKVLHRDSEAIRDVIPAPMAPPAQMAAPERPLRAKGSPIRLLALFAAVAATLLLLLQSPWSSSGDFDLPKQGEMLGGSLLGITDVMPEGAGNSFGTFRYSISTPGYSPLDLHSELSIWAHGAAEGSDALYTTLFAGTEWTLPQEALDSLPSEIRWEVKVSDQSMTALDTIKIAYAVR